jgi:hypothetical protein
MLARIANDQAGEGEPQAIYRRRFRPKAPGGIMNAVKLTVSAIFTAMFLCGPAVAQSIKLPYDNIPKVNPHDPVMEEDPERLKAISCLKLDLAMGANYVFAANQAAVQQTFPNPNAKKLAAPFVKRFQLERKEYKARCKEPAKELESAKKRFPKNPYIPNP